MQTTKNFTTNPQGSIWHRWEPHIHLPGTILADRYIGGENALEDFCDRIENSNPLIKVLGVTDYFNLRSYEKALELKASGRLNNIDLIFPNVELRFNIGTAKDSAINGHLLISPEDPNHVEEIKRFLQKLTFTTGLEVYHCQESDIIKLGYYHEKNLQNNEQALEAGTNQFKVDFKQLIEARKNSKWAQENILIGVAAGTNDGTSGLSNDASFNESRKFIERFSDIIFSGSDKQRSFWLGKGVLTKSQLTDTYNGCKPCIHGSDAHTNEKVGKPDLNRNTWIKGDLTFESIRQICIEPEERVFIGAIPPDNRIASNIIKRIKVQNAEWLIPNEIELNPGLITIIGARGSGKTALADLIAAGGNAISDQLSKKSFIKRAQEHLNEVEVKLEWETGENTVKQLAYIGYEDFEDSKVQYLSQQFVDQLCSSEGMTDELMDEIERVIFTAHPVEERLGVSNFKELLLQRSEFVRLERTNQEGIIQQSSEAITKEIAKKNSLLEKKNKLEELSAEINADKVSKNKLLGKKDDTRLRAFETISASLDVVGVKLQNAQTQVRNLNALKQSVDNSRASVFPVYTTKMKESHVTTGLSAQEWQAFKIDFTGDVDNILTKKISDAEALALKIKGSKITIDPKRNLDQSFLEIALKPEETTFEILTLEVGRLRTLIGVDTENGKQYSRLNDKILKQESTIEKLKIEIADCENAQNRIKDLATTRKDSYQKVFDAILEEELILKNLYLPLMTDLGEQKGTLGKLSFDVRRKVNIEMWANVGENLLDLRKLGPFKGKGSLLDAVKLELKNIWEKGTSEEIGIALTNFRNKHENDILEHAQAERKNQLEFTAWANSIAAWLYSTDHIEIQYGVLYDGVDIQQLSPGTRGIVLLLLYLAIDKEDDRPLIIDQPEENLDPQSIFDELVPLFRLVKNRRQIIIVTHNANLVVNTDADQVIIAKTGSHQPGKLPLMNYSFGGLENSDIRRNVCEILEGGEAAFKERAKRLRVNI